MTGFLLIIAAAGWYAAILFWTRLIALAREIERQREACRHHCPLTVCPGEVDSAAGVLASPSGQGRDAETGAPARKFGAR